MEAPDKVAPLDSSELLRERNYSFFRLDYPALEPERSETLIEEYIPAIGSRFQRFRGKRLYKHQEEAIRALESGNNVVLIAGTGSGKTEAWAFYALKRASEGKFTAMALYPTLALANDQVTRIEAYAREIGVSVVKIDRGTASEIKALGGKAQLAKKVSSSQLVLTNPAFLLSDVKRLAEKQEKALFYSVLRSLDLLVVDELDFYSPRSVALLLAMVTLLREHLNVPKQVVVMTATLSNPEEMCDFLKRVSGRECEIVRGRPFMVENRVYLITGKDLRSVWESVRARVALELRGKLDEDVSKALDSFEHFSKNPFRVLNYLRGLGLDVPLPGFSVEEIIEPYTEDRGLTIVFTRSIGKAEEIYRSLTQRELRLADRVAVHHHLVDRKTREEVERRAREGSLKVIISPRTLSQGIDIGSVVRVVHVGLPEEVREFRQREGRKGRREGILFTESVVIPQGLFDLSLLSMGAEAFKKWMELPLERTVINPDNKYVHLFTGLAKLKSSWMPKSLSEDERQALEAARVLKRSGEIDRERLDRVWTNMNFYEYSPPYGVPRSLLKNGGEVPLEPVGRCDLVEKFQPGCIDLSSGGIVVKLEYGKGRSVARIYERELGYDTLRAFDPFMEALQQYRDIKLRWGETPDFIRDVYRGKVLSRVDTVVYPPKSGFGELLKIPNRVSWIVKSDKPRLFRLGKGHAVVFDQRQVVVPVNTHGEYRDFTTGIVLEAREGEDPVLLRLGLAYLVIVLRRVYGYSINSLEYSVERVGGKVFFEVHEPESSGLLDKIDWLDLKRASEKYQPDELDALLLSLIDDIAWTDMLTLGLDWSNARAGALRVVDYILLRDRVEAFLGGRRFLIPRPSRALKVVAVDVIIIEEEERGMPFRTVFLASFDGEQAETVYERYPAIRGVLPPEPVRSFELGLFNHVIYEGFTVVVGSLPSMVAQAESSGLKVLARILSDPSSQVADLSRLLEDAGLSPPSLDVVIRHGKWGEEESLSEWVSASDIHRKVKALAESRSPAVADKIREMLAKRVKALYVLYLALKHAI